jgi:hypothetical protein
MKKILFILITFSLLLSYQIIWASNGGASCGNGICEAGENSENCPKDCLFSKAETLIRNLAVVAAVLMIVIGGFQWMTSTGDPGKIAAAKEKIYSALLGLLIVALAETISYLVGAVR